MDTNRDYKSPKLSPLNVGGLVAHELDKTKDPHFINIMRKYISWLKQLSQYKFPSIGNFHVHAVSRSRHNNRYFGKLTCLTPGGPRVVEYVIVLENFYDQILYFWVYSFNPTLPDCHYLLQ